MISMNSAKEAIDFCEKHLVETRSINTEIETFLVRFLLVLICAECEKQIGFIVKERVEKAKDPKITNFVMSATSQIFRSVRINEIKGLLGKFGNKEQEYFTSNIDDILKSAWDDIVSNRHTFVHGNGIVQLTFLELKERFEKSLVILEKIENALKIE